MPLAADDAVKFGETQKLEENQPAAPITTAEEEGENRILFWGCKLTIVNYLIILIIFAVAVNY